MARFSNLKTAVKKIYETKGFFEGVEGVGKGGRAWKRTTIAAIFCKVFPRRWCLQTDIATERNVRTGPSISISDSGVSLISLPFLFLGAICFGRKEKLA
jgi:hypothetical protein